MPEEGKDWITGLAVKRYPNRVANVRLSTTPMRFRATLQHVKGSRGARARRACGCGGEGRGERRVSQCSHGAWSSPSFESKTQVSEFPTWRGGGGGGRETGGGRGGMGTMV